ncbi:hypothetical protein [Nocardia sp. NPDC046763]|uniref:hypothetical protein n=1 Tax=Nocardia sp. NPDC046763 TaxID=3155256 RepID=UPI0033C7B39D
MRVIDTFHLTVSGGPCRHHRSGVMPTTLPAHVAAPNRLTARWCTTACVLHTTVTFDRPFGFPAVHRPTRLAMVAGWVVHPGR